MSRGLGCLLGLVLLLVAPGDNRVMAQSTVGEPALMIVFDGSGSMWGRLPGAARNKFQFTREQLLAGLDKKLARVRVGLTTFGERSSGGCTSSKLAVPLAEIAAGREAISQVLGKFNPKGRGPLVLGLRTALAALAKHDGAKRVLLIHDGPDNCDQDLCALVTSEDVRRSGTVVDVITLAPKEKDRNSASCAAKATGGRFTPADDAAAVVAALSNSLADTASQVGRVAAPNSKQPAATTEGDETSEQGTGLTLIAQLDGGSKLLAKSARWRIRDLSEGEKAKEQMLSGGRVGADLQPGRYRVTLLTDFSGKQSRVVTVQENRRSKVSFGVDAGLILLRTVVVGSKTLPRDGLLTLRRGNGGAAADVIWVGPATSLAELYLPPGGYELHFRAGLVSRSQKIKVAAGQKVETKLEVAMGELVLSVEDDGAGAADSHVFVIEADDPSEPSGRRFVARSTADSASFLLPAGTYYAGIRDGHAKNSVLVVLVSGQRLVRKLVPSRMVLRVSSRLGDSSEDLADGVRYRIWRSGQPDRPIVTIDEASPQLRLAPGRYRIESRVGRQNALIRRDFSISSGVLGSVILRHRAAKVDLKLANQERGPTYWVIADAAGEVVWRAFGEKLSATLAAGTYEVRATAAGRTHEQRFEVRPGRSRQVIIDNG